jgi:hypothetical protein
LPHASAGRIVGDSYVVNEKKREFSVPAQTRIGLKLLKFLHPSREVAERFPNATDQQRLDDLIATRLSRADRRGNNFEAVFFTSATFPGLELSCARENTS